MPTHLPAPIPVDATVKDAAAALLRVFEGLHGYEHLVAGLREQDHMHETSLPEAIRKILIGLEMLTDWCKNGADAMPSDIATITYRIAQGEATEAEWHAYAAFAAGRLREAYPDTRCTVETVDDATAGLRIETRAPEAADAPGQLFEAREAAAAFVGQLWDMFCNQ